MDALAGLSLLFNGSTFLALFGGVIYGLLVGIIPGIGSGMALALLLPLTITMDPATALAAIIGLMAVNTTSDTIPAVIFGVPGSAGAAATVMDGHPMSRQGRTKEALGAAYAASMIGGVFGAILLGIAIPIIGPLIPKIGTPELLAVCVLGMSFASAVAGRSVLKGMASALIGVLLSFIGMATHSVDERWTFDWLYLWDGVPIIPLALGLFAIPAMIDFVNRPNLSRRAAPEEADNAPAVEGDSLMRGVRAALRHWLIVLRSSWIGVALGAVPGVGVAVIDWIAYGTTIRTARNPEKFGQGDVRGVIAPEASNNAKDGGSLIPTLTLGIPGSFGMALVLGAFMIHGIAPGRDMIEDNLDITYMLVWGLVVANLIGAGICLAFTPQLARVLDIPTKFLIAALLTMVMMGAFQGTQSLDDLWMLIAIGGISYVMKIIDWPRPPLVLGFVLGEVIERYLYISIQVYDWNWLLRWPVILMLAGAVFVLVRPLIGKGQRISVSFEGAIGEQSRGMAMASAVFAGIAALAIGYGLVVASDWSEAGRTGPILVGSATIVLLVAVLVTSLIAARRAERTTLWRAGTGRGFIMLAAMAGFVIVAGLIGMLPTVLFFVPVVYRMLGGRLDWRCLLFTLAMFAFTVIVFDWLIAMPWPKPTFPFVQDFIFDALH